MNEFLILLQAKLDELKSKDGINSDILELERKINSLKLNAELDEKSLFSIKKRLEQIANETIKLSNITIDQDQINTTGKNIGKLLGNNIDKGLQSSLYDVKQNISNTLKELDSNKLSTVDLSKMFNLNRANLDTSVKNKVKGITKELNSLAKEVVTTGTDASWEKLLNNLLSLNKVLNTSGMSRDLASFKESLDILDYFQNKKIFVGKKSDALDNTGLSVRELNNQFRNLGVTFTTVSEGSTKLDSIWSELFNFSPNLRDITAYGDQLNAVVEHLKIAKDAKFGATNLMPVNSQDVSKVLVDWFGNIEKLQRKMEGFQQDQAEIEERILQQSNNSKEAVINNENEKQKAYENTAKAKRKASEQQGKISETDSIIKSGRNIVSFDNVNNAARNASEYFKNLLDNEKAVITVSEQFDHNNSLNSFTVNVKRANGEVESLRYSLKNIGTLENPFYAFADNGGSINDSGSIKQIKAIENAFASFTQKYEQFKSVHNSKLSGLTEPLADFELKLQGLKNGSYTIDEVKNSFNLLRAAASEIDAPLKRQLDTFSSYKNAVEHGKEAISGYRAELKGLSNAPKELSKELTKASKLLLQINKTEANEGTTTNWSRQAKEFKELLDSIRNKINVIKKEQANSASTQVFNVKDLDRQGKIYLQKVSNTIEKTKSALESKLRNAGYSDIEIKGTEDASGKIKSLTANVTDAIGVFKQLNFERAKIQNQGKVQSGFIQTDDVKVAGSLSVSIKSIQDNLSSLKSKWLDQGIVGDFKNKVEQLESTISTLGSKNELNGLKSQLTELKNEASKFIQANKIQFQVDTGGYESKVESIVSRTMQWTDGNNNARISTDELRQSLDRLTAASAEYANNKTEENQRRLIEAEKEFDKQIKTVTNSVRKMNAELAKDSTISSLHNKIQSFYDNNTAAHRQWGSQLKQMLSETASGAELTTQRVREIEQSFNNVATAARQAGKVGKSWFQSLKESTKIFSAWTSPAMLIMRGVSEVKQAVSEMKELDNTLTEISKTSGVARESLEDMGMAAYDSASRYGRTASDYLTGVQEMARSGFYGNKGTAMAEQSLLAQAAGDMSADIANQYILATNAAYKFNGEAEKLNAVLDGQNMVCNRNSVALADMAAGMSKAGTVASSYNVSVEDLTAMIGTMEAVTKSGGEEVGNSLKSILINLQNVTSSKITGTLAKANASMTEFVNGTEKLRDPIEILRDLAKTFNALDEDDPLRAEILTNVGGKYQASKLAALLQNVEMMDKMLVDYSEGSGSALAEADKSANNLTGTLNKLSNSWTELVNTFVNAGELTSAVNVLNNILQTVTNIVDKLGSLGTIGLGVGLFAGIKNVGGDKMYSSICYLF